MHQRKPEEAIAHWQTAVQLNPLLFDALYNLGTVLYDSGKRAEARPYLERFVERAPTQRYGPDIANVRAMLARGEAKSEASAPKK
jgi:tetratricopeptide (TPR) repeat protein